MGFGSPWILWALAAIAIPIIIHLFYFRRYKKIYFSNIQFLQEAIIEQKKSGKVQQLLILLCRILTFTFLILAFALPFFGKKAKGENSLHPLVIYVDNTFSMSQIHQNRTLLEEAKSIAMNIVENVDAQRPLMILTNDIAADQKTFYHSSEAKSIIEKIQVTSSSQNLENWNHSLAQYLKDVYSSDCEVIYISDFQSNGLPDKWDSLGFESILLPLQINTSGNASIDSVAFLDPVIHPNAENKLLIKLKNQGPSWNTQLHLKMNEEVIAVKEVHLPENGTLVDTLSLMIKSTPWIKGQVTIADAQVSFDNTLYFVTPVAKNNKVLLLEEVQSSKNIFQLFNADDHFVLQRQSTSQAQITSDYSLVVLNEVRKIPSALIEEIKNFVQNGGNLYIVPSMEVGAEVYQPLLNALSIGSLGEIKTNNQNVVDINLQEPIVTIAFEKIPHNIDLPKVFKYWTITSSYKVAESSILKMDNGRSFLQKYQLGDGWVYLQASSLDVRDNDFASKVIFAPLVYNFAVVQSNPSPLYYTINQSQIVKGMPIKQGSQQAIRLKSGQYEWIPPIMPSGLHMGFEINSQLEKDGIYEVMYGEQSISNIACNYGRMESEMKFTTFDELKNKFASDFVQVEKPNEFLQKNSSGILKSNTALWKVCLILAIIFLIAEILLIRFSTNSKTNEIQAQ